jgi:hypothetical protein
MARTVNNLGILARQRGDLPEAIRHHERSLTHFREAQDRGGEARAVGNVAIRPPR